MTQQGKLEQSLRLMGCPEALVQTAIAADGAGDGDLAMGIGFLQSLSRGRVNDLHRRDILYPTEIAGLLDQCLSCIGEMQMVRVLRFFQMHLIVRAVAVLEDGGAGGGWDHDRWWQLMSVAEDGRMRDLGEDLVRAVAIMYNHEQDQPKSLFDGHS